MKIKFYKYILISVLLFFNSNSIADTVFFDSKNIKVQEDGNMIFATKGSLDASLPIGAIVSGLKEGLNTAFYTTVCGIIFSLPLQVQIMILKFKLAEDKK